MKKLTVTFSLVFIFSNLFSQKVKDYQFQKALEILVSKVNYLSKEGFEIKAIMMKKDWGEINLDESELNSKNIDTVFTEAIVLSTTISYFTDLGGLSVLKKTDSSNISLKEKIILTNTQTTSRIYNKARVNNFKAYFLPKFKSKTNISTVYTFNVGFIYQENTNQKISNIKDETVVSGKTNLVGESGLAVILLIYVKK